MNTTMTEISLSNMSRLAPLVLVALLTFGLFFMNLREGASLGASSYALSDAVLTTTVGAEADAGACGIFAGLAIGVIAAAAGGVTIGLGAAVVISAGLHISAAICVS